MVDFIKVVVLISNVCYAKATLNSIIIIIWSLVSADLMQRLSIIAVGYLKHCYFGAFYRFAESGEAIS